MDWKSNLYSNQNMNWTTVCCHAVLSLSHCKWLKLLRTQNTLLSLCYIVLNFLS